MQGEVGQLSLMIADQTAQDTDIIFMQMQRSYEHIMQIKMECNAIEVHIKHCKHIHVIV